jgi:hypothetical protein
MTAVSLDPNGYQYINWLHHPLADSCGRVRIHRLVLHKMVGPGVHRCHWCGKSVSWDDGTLQPDHLNWVKTDNRPENLVVSCGSCNGRRRRPGSGRQPGGPFNW